MSCAVTFVNDIRGWVYVISNPSIPGLIKIGFSRKDPVLRARELDGTGLPTPYRVEFDALVWNPSRLERRVHERLRDRREGKEWFRCSVTVAARLILDEAGSDVVESRAADRTQTILGETELDSDSPFPPGHALHGFYIDPEEEPEDE